MGPFSVWGGGGGGFKGIAAVDVFGIWWPLSSNCAYSTVAAFSVGLVCSTDSTVSALNTDRNHV